MQRTKNLNKIKDEKRIYRFIEELSWLLTSYDNLDFRVIPELLKKMNKPNSELSGSKVMTSFISPNPNKHFLVGVLPRLLIDETLFVTNEDIAQFAKLVMKVNIPHFQKKSRYELIGHIVCKTNDLNDSKLQDLVKALNVLVTKTDEAKLLIKKRKEERFEWNLIIQELAKGKLGE